MQGLKEWIKILWSIPYGNSANSHSFEMMENENQKRPKIHLDVLDFLDTVKNSIFRIRTWMPVCFSVDILPKSCKGRGYMER